MNRAGNAQPRTTNKAKENSSTIGIAELQLPAIIDIAATSFISCMPGVWL